jgi:TPP-dependent 2-oxoacid decarboxylase
VVDRHGKQDADRGYSRVGGLNALITTVCIDGVTPLTAVNG